MTDRAQAKRAAEVLPARNARELGRRRLLQGMANGGGAMALAGVAGEALTAEAESGEAADGHTQLSLKATDHVRWYYARARW